MRGYRIIGSRAAAGSRPSLRLARPLALIAFLACAAAALSAPRPALAAEPAVTLGTQPGDGYLCFRNIYDEAHLRSHPGQLTTSALLSLAIEGAGPSVWLKLRLDQSGSPAPADIAASCAWSARANADTQGNRLLPAHPRDDGFACVVLYGSKDSAEAGFLIVDLAPDGGTVTVYLPETIRLWRAKAAPGTPPFRLGREDRVLVLRRAEPSACAEMERAIALSRR
jgi:hypothetical protein